MGDLVICCKLACELEFAFLNCWSVNNYVLGKSVFNSRNILTWLLMLFVVLAVVVVDVFFVVVVVVLLLHLLLLFNKTDQNAAGKLKFNIFRIF